MRWKLTVIIHISRDFEELGKHPKKFQRKNSKGRENGLLKDLQRSVSVAWEEEKKKKKLPQKDKARTREKS